MTTTLVPDRETALRVGYVATDWTAVPLFARYVDALEGWTVRAIVRDGEVIGAAFTRGPEWHVSILPSWRGRWVTRGLLKDLIAEPVSVTRVTPGHERVHGFLTRLGFEHRGAGLFVKDLSNGH